jgi:radical SAM superfamily enzyme YgiQ (UPF0313 family)
MGLKHIMVCEPLELEYIAAEVPEHDVWIVDEIMGDDTERALRSFKPHVVGSSAYITGVDEVRRICRTARQIDPGVLTVAGGVHATVVPEDFCRPEIDVVVRGTGPGTFASVVDAFADGGDFADISNLAIPDGDTLWLTAEEALTRDRVEAMPLPRRDLVERHRNCYYYLCHRPVSLLKTSYGCPYRCTFCFCWRITDGIHIRRSPESVADELAALPTREVYIVDDTFLMDRGFLLELAAEIRRRGIDKEYLVYGRSDFIARNEDVIREWSELGLKAAIVGLEYMSDSELQTVDKRAGVEDNERALDVLHRNHVDPYVSLILDPSYTRHDFRRVGRYIREQGLYYIVLQCLTPLPGTLLYPEYEEQLTVDRQAYPIWDISHLMLPSRLSPRQFYRQMAWLYLKTAGNPFRARRLNLRTAPRILSNSFLRLIRGAYRILFSLTFAHHQNRRYRRGSFPPRNVQVRRAVREEATVSEGHQ